MLLYFGCCAKVDIISVICKCLMRYWGPYVVQLTGWDIRT